MDKGYMDHEIQQIMQDKKEKKRRPMDTEVLIYYMALLLPLVFFCCFVKIDSLSIEQDLMAVNGHFWTCKKCKTSQWSDRPDWKGDYYCGVCNTKSGDE